MIHIDGRPADLTSLERVYPEESIERRVLTTLRDSRELYTYDSQRALLFELRLRREIVRAAAALDKSGLAFEVFRESRCNPAYWRRRGDGGFVLKEGVPASGAIRDIFDHGSRYGTECATAMQLVYYKALLDLFPEKAFDALFQGVVLMNWSDVSAPLGEIGRMRRGSDFMPGDRRYFSNPDVDPRTPEWQGENVIDMGDGTYYGHGVGRHHGATFIRELNGNRRPGADREATLLDTAGRPDFKKLSLLYDEAGGTA